MKETLLSPESKNPCDETNNLKNTSESGLDNKLFITMSDVIKRINSNIHEIAYDNGDGDSTPFGKKAGGFELEKQFPGGYTRKADESDVALVDFHSKVKQAAQMVSGLSPAKKIEWAKMRRKCGNSLFQKGDYKEAMDVYLTCLVAIEQGSGTSSGDGTATGATIMEDEVLKTNDSVVDVNKDAAKKKPEGNIKDHDNKANIDKDYNISQWNRRSDEEIKLPILLNLAACTLKMGMYKKAEKFCNFAINEMPCGKTSTKAYFRRGRARMLMGSYNTAKEDFNTALELLSMPKAENGNDKNEHIADKRDREAEMKSVKNEMLKLCKLTETGERNKTKCKKAMKRVLGNHSGGGNDRDNFDKSQNHTSLEGITDSHMLHNGPSGRIDDVRELSPDVDYMGVTEQYSTGLYNDMTMRRAYSCLRARTSRKEKEHEVPEVKEPYMLWYIKMIERALRKLLYWLGDEKAMTRSFEELEDEFSQPLDDKKQL